jgi:hypothetical protein
LPKRQQRAGEAVGLDSMRRVEVVSFGESLDREVGEDGGQAVGHPSVVVGVAAAAEREVDRAVEFPQHINVEIVAVERVQDGTQTRRTLRHPRRRRTLGRRRRLNAGCQLKPYEARYELIGRQRIECRNRCIRVFSSSVLSLPAQAGSRSAKLWSRSPRVAAKASEEAPPPE